MKRTNHIGSALKCPMPRDKNTLEKQDKESERKEMPLEKVRNEYPQKDPQTRIFLPWRMLAWKGARLRLDGKVFLSLPCTMAGICLLKGQQEARLTKDCISSRLHTRQPRAPERSGNWLLIAFVIQVAPCKSDCDCGDF